MCFLLNIYLELKIGVLGYVLGERCCRITLMCGEDACFPAITQ